MSAFLVPLGPLGLIFHDSIFDYFRLFILRNFQEIDEERERWTKINYRCYPDKKNLSTFFPRILSPFFEGSFEIDKISSYFLSFLFSMANKQEKLFFVS